MDTVEFRHDVRAADVDSIAAILKSTGRFSTAEQQMGISLMIERLEKGDESGYAFLIAQQDGAVVGYSCYGPIPCTMYSYDLYWIAVKSAFQGKGIGSAILSQTEREIRSLGGRQIYVETSSTPLYDPTRAFYVHHGYSLEAQISDYYAPGDDKIIYVKRLG